MGVLAAAALTHPALARTAQGSSALAASALAIVSFGSGLLIYGDYRAGVKHELLGHAFGLAQAFEVKEHLAFCVVVLAGAGAGLLRAGAPDLARTCYRAGASLGWLVVGIGWLVCGWTG